MGCRGPKPSAAWSSWAEGEAQRLNAVLVATGYSIVRNCIDGDCAASFSSNEGRSEMLGRVLTRASTTAYTIALANRAQTR
jgi:hypothetical protein